MSVPGRAKCNRLHGYRGVKIWMRTHSAESRSVWDKNMMALAFWQHLWQHCSWVLLICPHISPLLSSELLAFLDTSLSSLKTACPHSLYRPFELDRGFAALCFKQIQSWFSVISLGKAEETRGVKCQFLYQALRVTGCSFKTSLLLSSTSPSLHLENLTNKFFRANRKASRQLKYKNITRTFFFFFFFWFLCFFSSNSLDARIGFRNVSCLKMNQLSWKVAFHHW